MFDFQKKLRENIKKKIEMISKKERKTKGR